MDHKVKILHASMNTQITSSPHARAHRSSQAFQHDSFSSSMNETYCYLRYGDLHVTKAGMQSTRSRARLLSRHHFFSGSCAQRRLLNFPIKVTEFFATTSPSSSAVLTLSRKLGWPISRQSSPSVTDWVSSHHLFRGFLHKKPACGRV